MWCPSCQAEFVEGITRCPECEVDLVEALPEEELEYIPETCKMVLETSDEVQASLVAGLLNENDIPCKIENASFHANPVVISNDINCVRLWVEEEQLEDAQKILAEAENYCLYSECGGIVLKEDTTCNDCGATLEE